MADIYGQLVSAQLENLASDPVGAPTGRAYFNTTLGLTRLYDGTQWRSIPTTETASVNAFVATIDANDSNRTLTSASPRRIAYTGFTASRDVVLPTTSVVAGDIWILENQTSQLMVVKASGGSIVSVVNGANANASITTGSVELRAKQNTPTLPAHWQVVNESSSQEGGVVGAKEFGTATYGNTGIATFHRNTIMTQRVGDSLHVTASAYVNGAGSGTSNVYLSIPTYNGESITFPTLNSIPLGLVHSFTDDNDFSIVGNTTSGSNQIALRRQSNLILEGQDVGGFADEWHFSFIIPVEQWAGTGVTLTQADTTAKTKVITPTFSSTPAGWSLVAANIQGFRSSDGKYSARVNFRANITSAASATVTIDGIVAAAYNQALSSAHSSATGNTFADIASGTGNVSAFFNGGNSTVMAISGVVDLGTNKPSWFDANIENVLDASIFVSEASASAAGLQATRSYAFFKKSSSQTGIASNTDTKVAYDTATTNVGADFNTSTNRFTAPVTGVYHYAFNIAISASVASALTQYQAYIKKNGSNERSCALLSFSSATSAYVSSSGHIELSAGDYIEFWANATVSSGTWSIDHSGGGGLYSYGSVDKIS